MADGAEVRVGPVHQGRPAVPLCRSILLRMSPSSHPAFTATASKTRSAGHPDADLDDTRAFPEPQFTAADDAAKHFLAIRTSPDYNDAGRARQLDAAASTLAAGAQTLTDPLVKRFSALAGRWVGQARDPGRALLLGKGVPPDVMQLVATCATAPIPLVIALLEQLTPLAPDDLGD